MPGIYKPTVKGTIESAFQTIQNDDQKILFIGQMDTNVGTATPKQLVKDIGNANEEDVLFGTTSLLTAMIRGAKQYNRVNRFDAIPLDDPATPTAASGTVTFGTGPAAADSTIYVTAGSKVKNRYKIEVSKDDTITQIGDKLVAVIATDRYAVTYGANAAGVVTITAEAGMDGVVGNDIPILVEGTIPDVTIVIVGMAGGVGDADITNLFDVVQNIRYQTVVWVSQYDVTVLQAYLDPRFNPPAKALDGVGIFTQKDTFANLIALAATANDQSLTVFGYDNVSKEYHKGMMIPELPSVVASQFAAVRALRRSSGSDITQYVIGGDLDNTGGIAISSLPYMNTPFQYLPLIEPEDFWTTEERNELIEKGISVVGNNLSEDAVIADEIVTTYLKDSADNSDITFHYLNYVDTQSSIREYFMNNTKRRFDQQRLTSGSLIPGRNVSNAQSIAAYIDIIYQELAVLALTVSGEDARNFFKRNRKVTIDIETGTANITMRVPIITQLRNIEEVFKISFSIGV